MLDTNVVVSALLWGGEPFKLIRAAAEGEVELFTSTVLLSELREVLARDHLVRRLAQVHSSIESALDLYGELTNLVSPRMTPRVVPGDPDDDHVIAAAVAASAAVIVSGDRHLLELVAHDRIIILNARDAVLHLAKR